MTQLLTVRQTAQMLRVAPITIRRYIADGKLEAVRVGRGVRVPEETVAALLEPVQPKRQAKSEVRVPRGRPLTKEDPSGTL
jgi:excisionase family DNA binding protein